jgi:phosphatidate cytidylyltransferase
MDFPERPGTRPSRREDPIRIRRDDELEADRPEGPFAYDDDQGPLDPVPGAPDEADAGYDDQPLPNTEAPPRERRRRSSETWRRVLWAIPLVVLAVTVIAAGSEIFAAAMIGFAWIGLTEFFNMAARARPMQWVAYAAAAGMIVAAHFGDSFHMVLAGVAFFPVMLAVGARRPTLKNLTWSMAVTTFAIVWIGLPFAHAVLLRDLPDHGAALLVDVLVATFFTDTFAYLGGRTLGSRPLAPRISPAKTIEGFATGVLGGTLGFWAAGLYQDWMSGTEALLMGLCIALLAPVGDLFESAIKRDLEIKDSGRVFGPHGGLLDRLDGVLFTVVAGYYLSLWIVL